MATFRIWFDPGAKGRPPTEEVEADLCLHVGDWIELLERSAVRPTTVVRIVHRADVIRIVEVAKPTVVVHLLRGVTAEQADEIVGEVGALLDSPAITGLSVRGDGIVLSSPVGADLVARLDQSAGRRGAALEVVTTRDAHRASTSRPVG
jgi:hypothetical protein